MRVWVLFAVLLCLCSSAAAWGPVAGKFICHESVKYVWGVDAIAQCIPLRDQYSLGEFCAAAYRAMGRDYEAKCEAAVVNGSELHPALVSYAVFGDSENRFDFSRCPIINKGEGWVCGESQDRPAYITAEKWFREAESAPNMCSRIYYFCVGASYYAESESSLHQVRFIVNDCVGNIEESIDRSIENGLSEWGANQLCVFDKGVRGSGARQYKQRMGESSSTLNRIISNLTERGLRLKSMPYKAGAAVVVLANGIDFVQASGFMDYLASNGVYAVHSDAADFERLKYGRCVIILGGHNSPDGVGSAVGPVMSSGEKDSLMSSGASLMFVKEGVWDTSQRVMILAGNEAADTLKAWSDNKEKVLEEIKKG